MIEFIYFIYQFLNVFGQVVLIFFPVGNCKSHLRYIFSRVQCKGQKSWTVFTSRGWLSQERRSQEDEFEIFRFCVILFQRTQHIAGEISTTFTSRAPCIINLLPAGGDNCTMVFAKWLQKVSNRLQQYSLFSICCWCKGLLRIQGGPQWVGTQVFFGVPLPLYYLQERVEQGTFPQNSGTSRKHGKIQIKVQKRNNKQAPFSSPEC